MLNNDVPWTWTTERSEACKAVKQLFASSSVLVHYRPDKPVILAVDASPYVPAVISHEMDDGSDRPFAYASRILTSAKRKYSQIEKEALAIIIGIQKFHMYLYGRRSTLLTDNKPLS